MALTATIRKAELQISDMDRGYYATHNVTLAQHPSETDDRLMVRLLAFALNTSAYTTEIFAGAIRSVPAGEIEAARAYGFSSVKMYRCIILPSALRIALPAYSNEVILMLHSTALAFTATVPDLLKIARDINSATYQPFTAFGIAAVLYLIISYVLISLFRRAEKRWLQHIKPSSTH